MRTKGNDRNTSNQTTDNPRPKYRGLTCTTHLSDCLKKLLIKTDENLKIDFKPLSTISRIVPTPNEKTLTQEQHGVIYKFKCNDCEGCYTGQTGQKLKNILKQHLNDHKKPKTNTTAAFYHAKNTGHTFNLNNTEVIATEKHLHKRLILESIHINMNKNKSINLKSDIDTLNPAYSSLIQITNKHK